MPNISPWMVHAGGLVQDCGNHNALAMELLQFYTKPLMCW